MITTYLIIKIDEHGIMTEQDEFVSEEQAISYMTYLRLRAPPNTKYILITAQQ